MLTGYDTLMRIQQLLQTQQRFRKKEELHQHTIKGVPGVEAGFVVATYNGVPITFQRCTKR